MITPNMPQTYLFGNATIATAVVGTGKYEHTFGGPPDRKGTQRSDCGGLLIHLLHRFDLTDPTVPITIPGVRWLPFYYCFDFRTNDLGYQLTSDDTLITFIPNDDPNVSKKEAWPDKNYPLEFPKSNVHIASFNYDPTNPVDAVKWAGVFGISHLAPSEQTAIKTRLVEEMDGLGLGVPETEEEFQDALWQPFAQGRPNNTCLNPRCGNYKQSGHLSTIALMPAEPIPGVHTFGRSGSDVQLIFQLCNQCYTIRVSNQCD